MDGEVLSTSRPQRLVALAHDAAEFTRVRGHLQGLTMAGHTITLVWLTGEPARDLEFLALRRRVRPGLLRSPKALRQVLSTPRQHWRGDRTRLADAIRLDPATLKVVAASDGVMAFGERAKGAVKDVVEGRSVRVPHKELRGWAGLARVWEEFASVAQADGLSPDFARELAEWPAILKEPAPDAVQGMLSDFLTELTRSGHHEQALALLPLIRTEDEDPVEVARRRALLAYTRTSGSGREDPDLRASAAELLTATDTVLAAGDVERAAALTTVALGLLFHVELHADKLSTPLIEEPETFLRDWQASEIARTLARPVPQTPPPEQEPEQNQPEQEHGHEPDRTRVIVLRGSYPQFSAQLIDALERRPDVDVTVHSWDRRGTTVKGLGVRPEPIEERLRQAVGEQPIDDELTTTFGSADAIFIDWADRGALVALMHVPAGVHVTLRIHSMDALSPWLHLIDWSRVDDLVFVSDHLRDTVQRLLGERLAGTRLHVLPNTLDASRIPEGKSEGHRRRLLMIGWAQPVKDPAWALDVLGRLRAHDPQWRLTLVGPDFSPGTVTSGLAYMADFRERLTAEDVCGGVDFVGHTRDITPHLAAAGFVVSSSRRESFGLGLVEGAASGAVPVVRNWPIFASLDGARRLFPAAWVVDTVDEAVGRILAHAEEESWSAGSARTRAAVAQRFVDGEPAVALSRIVLGEAQDSAI